LAEDENIQLIPVTWIKQYHFCPRIIYYIGVLGFNEMTTESMIEGKEFHIFEEKRSFLRKTLAGERKEFIKRSWSRVYALSNKLGLYGIIDEVAETNDGLVVIENKYAKAPRKPHSGHIYQAIAYAMLAEEIFNKNVKKIIIRYVYDKKSFEIKVTEELKKHVIWTISRIRSIIEKEKIPRGINNYKCNNCGFRKMCKDIR